MSRAGMINYGRYQKIHVSTYLFVWLDQWKTIQLTRSSFLSLSFFTFLSFSCTPFHTFSFSRALGNTAVETEVWYSVLTVFYLKNITIKSTIRQVVSWRNVGWRKHKLFDNLFYNKYWQKWFKCISIIQIKSEAEANRGKQIWCREAPSLDFIISSKWHWSWSSLTSKFIRQLLLTGKGCLVDFLKTFCDCPTWKTQATCETWLCCSTDKNEIWRQSHLCGRPSCMEQSTSSSSCSWQLAFV